MDNNLMKWFKWAVLVIAVGFLIWFLLLPKGEPQAKECKTLNSECTVNSSEKPCCEGLVCVQKEGAAAGIGKCEEGCPTITPTPQTPYVEVDEGCGGGLTFHNPTKWLFVFDVRVDDEAYLDDGTSDPWYGLEIKEGPLKGQKFGARWREVVVDGRADQHQAYLAWTDLWKEDSGLHKVEYRLAEGAEQQMYFDWVTVREVESDCEPNVTPTPIPEPTPTEKPQEPSLSEAGAPQCTDPRPVQLPANPLVWRNGGCAIVQWMPTEGNNANVYYYQVQDPDNAHAVRDTDNDGYVEICDLGGLDWTFGIQQANGCAGGDTVWIEDGNTNGWILFLP